MGTFAFSSINSFTCLSHVCSQFLSQVPSDANTIFMYFKQIPMWTNKISSLCKMYIIIFFLLLNLTKKILVPLLLIVDDGWEIVRGLPYRK